MTLTHEQRTVVINSLKRHKRLIGECWIWDGTRITVRQYGVVKIRPVFGRRFVLAHRASAAAYLGFDIASNLEVCHRCDTPPCFNPDHLFVGTRRDNVADMWRKGRASQTAHKLNMAKAKAMRQMWVEGASANQIATTMKVSYSLVYRILRGEIWKTDDAPVMSSGKSRHRFVKKKLAIKDVRAIRTLRAEGHTLLGIAKRFGVCHQTIAGICSGVRWRHVS